MSHPDAWKSVRAASGKQLRPSSAEAVQQAGANGHNVNNLRFRFKPRRSDAGLIETSRSDR